MLKSNFKTRLKNLEAVIWDLDNTLYRFSEEFEHACHIAAAKAAMKNGFDAGFEETLAICLRSYEQHGHSYRLFIEQHSLDQTQMHFDFHSFIDEKLVRAEIELITLFEKTHLDHVLVTHASREWAERTLDHIGLKKFFPDEKIIPAEDTNFARKSESQAPFEQALTLLNKPAGNVMVVEDIADNLTVPHSMGLGTVLLHYGRPPDPKPPYIDMDCNNAIDFFEALLSYKASG